MSDGTLPGAVVAFIEWIVRDPVASTGLIGDLEERYGRAAESGRVRRWTWLAGEVLAIGIHYARDGETGMMDSLRQDIGYSFRSLARRPGFSALVVATLALGIGANAAIFSVVNGLLLEPLPFNESDRLVLINEVEPSGFTASVSFPNYRDWKERSRSFDNFSTILPGSPTFATPDGSRVLEVGWVMGGFFETLGTEPALGRYFSEAESEPGAAPIAVLAHPLWIDEFGGDPSVLGRTVTLNGDPFEIVGVAASDFLLYEETSVFLPLGFRANALPWDDRQTSVGAEIVARLSPGVSEEEAQADLRAVATAISAETGEVEDSGNLTTLRSWFLGDVGRQSLLLMAAVALMLFVACANVANLLFVASERRGGEMALRSALGAGAGRVYRQLFTESLLIAVLGGGLGLGLAVLGVEALVVTVGDVLPFGFADRIAIDASVLAFTALLSLGTAILAGFLPALRSTRAELADRLRAATPSSVGKARGRSMLIVSEVALSMILLVGAGLLIATLAALQNVEKGFDGTGVITFRIQTPPGERYESRDGWADLHRRLRDGIVALPGVVSAATSNHFPLAGSSWEMLYRDEQTPPEDEGQSVLLTMVSPSFFDAYAIPIVEGRNFTEVDAWGAELVAIVDESLAESRWPNESAIGKRITFEKTRNEIGEEVDVWRTVVGVAGHVRHYELASRSRIEAYTPIEQSVAWGFSSYVSVRATTDLNALLPNLRAIVAAVDPTAPMYRVRTIDGVIDQELGMHRAMRELLSIMALLTLALGCIGIYSVVSHGTALRLRELSLRIALGGAPGRITRMVLRDSIGPVAIGIVVGGLGAVALGRVLRSVLFEVGPTDPVVLGSAAAILMVVATVSAWLPARRAGRVEPQEVLRGD